MLFDGIVTAFYIESLAGTFINIRQHTIGIIIDHVDQRRVEHRMIAHQQLTDILLPALVFRDIVQHA